MRFLPRPNRAVEIYRPEPIQLQTPQAVQRGRRGLIIFIFVFLLIGILLTYPAVKPKGQSDNIPSTMPPMTTPLVSDYVLNQDERIRLENEQRQIQLQIDQINDQIQNANLARQQELINRRTELELERTGIQNQIEQWNADRERKRLDLEVQNNARATSVAIEATVQAYNLASDTAAKRYETQLQAERYKATAEAFFYALAGILAVIAVLVLAVLVVGKVLAWWKVSQATAERKAAVIKRNPPTQRPQRDRTVVDEFTQAMNPTAPPVEVPTSSIIDLIDQHMRENAVNTVNTAVNTVNTDLPEVVNTVNTDLLRPYVSEAQLNQLPLESGVQPPRWAVEAMRRMNSDKISRTVICTAFYNSTGRNYSQFVKPILDGVG